MIFTSLPSEVAIIGAGLAGMTLALALHDLGILSTVYEARAQSYDQGGGIMLSPSALRVLDSVGVYERVRAKALQFDVLTSKDGKDDTVDLYYFGSAAIYDCDAIRIIAASLCITITKVVRDDDELVEFEFENGKTATAPLLIGADGIHSTRSQLRIPEGYSLPATVMGKSGAFLLVPQKPDGSEMFIGSQRRFPERDAAGWEALRQDKQQLYDMLQENKADWPDVVQSALEATPVERMGFWAFYGIPPLPSWLSDSKRIILVGGAAHAIPPTAGQGANQAFEDVRSLATLLAKLRRIERIKKVLDLTQQMNVKRLPEAERAKQPGAFWNDAGATRGEGGQLRWLYEPDLAQEAEKWVAELLQEAH
ncbi:kynurenine 3-monooxygenase [Exidia glandulosa HHB12029]|uniref:Kynurenine 3-monooxygenase n=1 Tax=Exidia glandulosa HHB12029 TaxID=1314781 RepID=A0A165J5I3_EXIGL|nr:kynurenine 3-monooxygenase [Exidia glandulosa HHB12029]